MVDGGVLTLLLISFESDKIVTRENLSMISPLKLPYYVMIFLPFWIQILFQSTFISRKLDKKAFKPLGGNGSLSMEILAKWKRFTSELHLLSQISLFQD